MSTKAQINWASASFGSKSISRITTGGFGLGGRLLKFKGDTDVYSTIIADLTNEPRATFTTADVATHMDIPPGTQDTLTARLEGGDGAVGFTMINAVFENADARSRNAQFGTVTGTWKAFSEDGETSPLALSRE